MGRGDLTNAEWERLWPLLPPTGRAGGRWRDHRQVINGIIWRTRTGPPWRDLPERFGPWETCYKRFARWEVDGTWARIEQALQRAADAAGELDWQVRADTTVVRAHQHAAGTHKGGRHRRRLRPCRPWAAPAAARSTKIHVLGDGRGRPLVTRVTPGQAADTTGLLGLVDAVRVPRPGRVGRPRMRPAHLTADKAYSSLAGEPGEAAGQADPAHHPRAR